MLAPSMLRVAPPLFAIRDSEAIWMNGPAVDFPVAWETAMLLDKAAGGCVGVYLFITFFYFDFYFIFLKFIYFVKTYLCFTGAELKALMKKAYTQSLSPVDKQSLLSELNANTKLVKKVLFKCCFFFFSSPQSNISQTAKSSKQ